MIRRHNPSALRAATLRRDKGVCTSCGLDCGALEAMLEASYDWLVETAPVFDRGARPAWAQAQMALLRHFADLPPFPQVLWIADHLIPFEMGGADDLSNVQTLCWDCNRRKTPGDLRMVSKAKRIQAKAPRKHFGYGGGA